MIGTEKRHDGCNGKQFYQQRAVGVECKEQARGVQLLPLQNSLRELDKFRLGVEFVRVETRDVGKEILPLRVECAGQRMGRRLQRVIEGTDGANRVFAL